MNVTSKTTAAVSWHQPTGGHDNTERIELKVFQYLQNRLCDDIKSEMDIFEILIIIIVTFFKKILIGNNSFLLAPATHDPDG